MTTKLHDSCRNCEKLEAENAQLRHELIECREEAASLRKECATKFLAGYRSRDADIALLKRHQSVCQCGQFVIEYDVLTPGKEPQ